MKNSGSKTVVFSDLDGTVLDENYSLEFAQTVAARLMALEVPLVFCSSKTSAEMTYYRNLLEVEDPFVVENGGAVFIPENYFKADYSYSKKRDCYKVIELGVPYLELRCKLEKIRVKTGATMVGFGDMSVEEIERSCGLTHEMAMLAKQREYDEPFRIVSGDESLVVSAANQEGLIVTRGDRYHHLSGKHNKGSAASILKDIYKAEFGQVATFGVGNSENDYELLAAVDTPFFVEETANMTKVWGSLFAELEHLRSSS